MLNVRLDDGVKGPLTILCLGAHSDDIEIGCGGTIQKLLGCLERPVFHWVVFSAHGKRREEALASARALLKPAKRKTVVIHPFRDGYFPYIGDRLKDSFESLKKSVSPDLVFAPRRSDQHQDHRIVSELAWNTFRDHLILEYEIVKYDGDLSSPNVFVHLEEDTCRRKARHIADHFGSQSGNHWFDEETFLSLLRIRGVESNAPTGYAEAFHCRKLVLG
jgi:LmbE family N-acetylglucosaminyl deacetylase